jgi:hypothetical protein
MLKQLNRLDISQETLIFNNFTRRALPNSELLLRLADLGPYYYTQSPTYVKSHFTELNLLPSANLNIAASTLNLELGYNYYGNLKALADLVGPNFSFSYTVESLALLPTSYTTDLNSFMADLEESNWDVNRKVLNLTFNRPNTPDLLPRLTNPPRLRTTVKNLIVTHGAIQKVYKSRFDEGRSNMNPTLLFSTYLLYPFLAEKRLNYETSLSKNKESFFQNNTLQLYRGPNRHYSSFNYPVEFTLLDLPFLISLKSDASRYLWFDWHAR